MPNVSGKLVYDATRENTATSPGIGRVCMVLQKIDDLKTYSIWGSGDGEFRFNNVPAGEYLVAEAHGYPCNNSSPGNWTNAAVKEKLTAGNIVTSDYLNRSDTTITLPAGATKLDCVTPLVQKITVGTKDVTGIYFRNGPVAHVPLGSKLDSTVTFVGSNLILSQHGGTFGTYAAATPANTCSTNNPYPEVTNEYTYVALRANQTLAKGQFTFTNSTTRHETSDKWWNLSDREKGDETGRFMIVVGSNMLGVFYEKTISVTPNTDYIVSMWVANLYKYQNLKNPEVKVAIQLKNNSLLNSDIQGSVPATPNCPTWVQIASVFHVGESTEVTLRLSAGGGASSIADAFAIDDIVLQRVNVTPVTFTKTCNVTKAISGDKINYTVKVKNNYRHTLKKVQINDYLRQKNIEYVSSTFPGVIAEGQSTGGAMVKMFKAPKDIAPGETITVPYTASAVSFDNNEGSNGYSNHAELTYSYSFTSDESQNKCMQAVDVPITISHTADIVTAKAADKKAYIPGETVQYTVTVKNNGPSRAAAPVVTDTLPSVLTNQEYSTDGGTNWAEWKGSLTLAALAKAATSTVLLRGKIPASATSASSLKNTVTVKTTSLNKTGKENSTTATATPTVTDTADIVTTKAANQKAYIPGETVQYTVTVKNNGPAAAAAPVVTDTLPSVLTNQEYSADGGTNWAEWKGSVTLTALAKAATAKVLLRGKLPATVTSASSLKNTVTVKSSTLNKTGKENTTTATATPTVTDTADIVTAKAANKKTYIPGETVQYTVTVKNNGPAAAAAPVVTDTLPSVLTNQEYSTDGGTNWAEWKGSVTLAALAKAATAKVLLRGKLPATVTSASSLKNTVTVKTTSLNKTGKENTTTATATPTVTDTADIVTAKAANKKTYLPGETVQYTVTVKNNGPAAAAAPVVTDTLPSVLTNQEYSADGGTNWAEWEGSLTLAALAKAATSTVLLRGKIPASATSASSLKNTVTVKTTSLNKTGKENTTTATATPAVTDTADIVTAKAANKKTYLPGETVQYTVTVKNNGPAAAAAPVVTDPLPSVLTNQEYSTDGGTNWAEWEGSLTLAALAKAATAKVLLRGKLPATVTSASSLKNTVTVKSSTLNKTGKENTTTATATPTVTDTASLTVTKTSDKNSYLPGEEIIYTVTVKNNGPAISKAPSITDTIPAAIQSPTYSTDGGTMWGAWTGSVTLPDLPVDQTANLLIKGTLSATATGSLKNTATVKSVTPRTNGTATQETATADNPAVIDTAVVSVAKRADQANYLPGDKIVYTVAITNAGPAPAAAPIVLDTVPAVVENQEYSIDGKVTWEAWTGSVTLAELPAKKTIYVYLRGDISTTEAGSIKNTVTVKSATPRTDGTPTEVSATTSDGSGLTETASISVTKTASKANYLPGESIVYTVTIRNAGPTASKTPTVTDALPDAVLNATYSVDDGATWAAWTGSVTLSDIPANNLATVLIRGSVSDTATGSLANMATVTSPTPWPDGSPTEETGTVEPVVTDTAALSIAKTADKTNYMPGDDIIYTVTVTNKGPATAKTPTVTDALPETVLSASYSTDEEKTWFPWTGSALLSDITANASAQILIKGTVSATATGSLANSATVTSPTPKPDGTPTDETGKTPDEPAPAVTDTATLSVTKVADKTNYMPGEDITYTVTVTNNGPATSKMPTVTDTLPAVVLDAAYSTDSGTTWAPWTGDVVLSDIAANASAQILIKGTVSTTATGSLANSASVTSPTPKPDGTPTDENGKTPDTGEPATTDTATLSVAKTTDKTTYMPGENITYTITVANSGPATAKMPTVTDTLPAVVLSAEYSTDGTTWAPWTGSVVLSDLAAGANAQVCIRGAIGATATGSLANSASVTSPTPKPDGTPTDETGKTPDEPAPAVTDTAALSITKTADKTNYLPGEDITYTVTVTNSGPATSKTPTVTDTLPDAVLDAAYSMDRGIIWAPWTGSALLPDIAANASAQILIKGTVSTTATGSLANSATVTSPTPKPDGTPTDENGKTPDTGEPAATDTAALSVTKVSDKTHYMPGDDIIYTVTVANLGPATSKTPTVTDTLPETVLRAEYRTDEEAAWAPWTGSVVLSDIAAGARARLWIRGNISATATGSLANTATVTSPTPKPGGNPTDETGKTPDKPAPVVTDTAILSITKVADKVAYMPGDDIIYTVTVTNLGPATSKTPTVSDNIPSIVEHPAYSQNGGESWTPWTGSVVLSDIAANASAQILIKGTVSATATGSLANTASVTSPTPNPSGEPADETGKTPDTGEPVVAETAALSVTKTADKTNYLPGDDIIYTVTIANLGPAAAKEPTVTDHIPPAVEHPEYSSDGGATWFPWLGSAVLSEIAAGASAQVLIQGTVSTTAAGSLANTATVTTPTPKPDGKPGDETGKTPDTEKPVIIDTAKLSITKRADKIHYLPGDRIIYAINIRNEGPAAAKTPTVSDDVPPVVENPEYSTDGGTAWAPWPGSITLADMSARTTAQVLIRGKVSLTATGSLANAATVTSPTPRPDGKPDGETGRIPETEEPGITDTAALSVTKVADKTHYLPGDPILYTITIRNSGPADSVSLTVTDTLPAIVLHQQFSLDNGGTWHAWKGRIILPDLPAHYLATLLIRGTISDTATGSLDNTATVTSDTPQPDGAPTQQIVTTPGSPAVTDTARLALTKRADKTHYLPGDPITYTLDITNSGPATAAAPTVTDALPAAVSEPQYSTDGATWAPWTGRLSLPDMAPGAHTQILIKGSLSANATGSLANAAIVTSPTPRPDGSPTDEIGKTPDEPTPAVTDTASLTVTKHSDKKDYFPGNSVIYTVTVLNNGPATCRAPRVSDHIPAAIEHPEYSLDGGTTWAPWVGSVTLSDMPPKMIAQVLIKGNLSATATGSLANVATVTSPTPRPDGSPTGEIGKTPEGMEPTIGDTARLTVTKHSDKTAYRPGEPITYAINIRNNGPATSKVPVVTDTLPSVIESPEYSTDSGAAWAPWTGSVTLEAIAAGASVQILIKGTVSATATGSLHNTATVTSDTPQPDGAPTRQLAATPDHPAVIPISDLAVAVTSDNDSPKPGSTVTYAAEVKNNGPAAAADPKVSYAAPSQLRDIRYSTDGGTTWQPWEAETTLADIPNNGTSRLLVKGTVDPNAVGTIAGTFAVTGTNLDPDSSNNAATISSNVGIETVSALVTSIAVDNTAPKPTEKMTYTVGVRNAGPAAVPNPTLSLIHPASLENVEHSTDEGNTWQPWTGSAVLPSLSKGGSTQLLIRGVLHKRAMDSVAVTATATGPNCDTTPGTHTVTHTTRVTPTANLGTAVSVDNPMPKPGDTVTYTVTLKNDGPCTAKSPTVELVLPPRMVNHEFSSDGEIPQPQMRSFTADAVWQPWTGSTTVADIPDGGVRKLLIRGKIPEDATGDLFAHVSLSAITHDPDLSDNRATHVMAVAPAADLIITGTADLEHPNPGDTLTYGILIKNNGPSAAIDSVLTGSIPPQLFELQYSLDGGTTWQPWLGTATLGGLPEGSIVEVLIRGTVFPSASGAVIVNTVQVASSTPEINPANNTVDMTVTVQKEMLTVKFCDCNCVILTVQVPYGEKLNQPPAAPVRRGCIFAGWAERCNWQRFWDIDSPVTENMTLCACYRRRCTWFLS